MENIVKLHREMLRQGPGDNQSTQKAYDLLKINRKNLKVLDIGCGPGMQTIQLAKNIFGEVIALDYYKHFLLELEREAKRYGVDKKITLVEGSMFELEKYFSKDEFDVIWSEGAIYIIGFEKGIDYFQNFLKKDGYLVVSECSFLQEKISQEVKEYWEANYPDMNSVERNLELAKQYGYDVIGSFILPEESWWENYYLPLKERCKFFKETEPENKELMELIKENEIDMEMYKKYSKEYGYVFYILRKK